jgi:small subunit ribosomal protein S1
LTEEQMGGTAPEPEASASTDSPASENTGAAVAVADEPATTDVDSTNGVDDEAAATITAPVTGGDVTVDEASAPEPAATTSLDALETDAAPVAEPESRVTGQVTADEGGATAGEDESTAAADESTPSAANGQLPANGLDMPAPAPAPARPARTGPEPTTMAELLAQEETDIRSFKHGDVVEGNVVRIDKDEILVDIGAKSEGVVSNRELYGRNAETQPELNIGDTVLVYVLQPESPEGHVVLSLRRAGLERKWRAMQEQFEAGVIIEAPVIDHNKGGLIVDCGIRGFVPISQIVDFPRRPQNDQPRDAAQEIAEKLQPYVGRKLRLKILEVNRKANRLILSEKVALYEERREKRDELFSSLQVGQKVTGTVRSIAPFGVFIDLGGIDGLVHKSELSWNKVNNPEAGYKIGDEVEAEVIDINHERGRISLSIRRLQPDPWESTVADFNVGDVIDGTVTKLVNFGAFVRVREGLEGLIHISELSHQRVAHPGDVVHEGQQLKLKIISLDSERHRLGLSLKQAEEPPARAATEAPAPPTSAPRERSERRGRERDRSYSTTDAVQEPEGGIDNTLAAAFAQVREQLAASEAAGTSDATATPAEAEAARSVSAEAETATPVAEPETAEPETAEPETAEVASSEPSVAVGEIQPATHAEREANVSQVADVAIEGALSVGPDNTTDAISNSPEPAPVAASEKEAEARGAAVDAGATEAPTESPSDAATEPEPDAPAATAEPGSDEAVAVDEAQAAGE